MNWKKNVWLILIIILLLATLLRFWGISKESYWLDEAISIRQAQETNYSATFNMITKDVHLPLHITLLFFWVKIFGKSELSSRILSLIFGILGIWVFYLLTKKLYGEKTSLVSTLIFAISPIMIYYSQEARLYSLFVLLSLTSIYFFLKFIEKNDYKNLIYYSLSSLLLIYTHLFAFLLLFVQNIYILHINKYRIKKLFKWIYSQLFLIIMFLPWIGNLLKQVNRTLNTMWIPKPNIGIILKSILDLLGNKYILLIFLFCIIYVILTKNYKSIEKNKIVFLVLWIIVPFIIVLTYSYLISPVYQTRYLLFVIPAFFIIFGKLISRIFEKNKILAYTLLGLIIIFSFITIIHQVNHVDKDNWRSVAGYIKENVKEPEYTFINPFYHQDPFTYYFDSDCFKEQDIYSCNYNHHNILSLKWYALYCNDSTPLTATDDKNTLRDYTNETVWLISVREKLYAVPLFDYFNDTMNLIKYKEFGEIKIYKFQKK